MARTIRVRSKFENDTRTFEVTLDGAVITRIWDEEAKEPVFFDQFSPDEWDRLLIKVASAQ